VSSTLRLQRRYVSELFNLFPIVLLFVDDQNAGLGSDDDGLWQLGNVNVEQLALIRVRTIYNPRSWIPSLGHHVTDGFIHRTINND